MSSVGKVHLGLDDLSAFADGELEPGEAREARAHLDACGACSAELAAFTRLDNALLSTVPVDCAGSLELRSALLDGQLTAAEAAIAREHIQACQSCATDEVTWLASGQVLRLLPAALPSARVDAAIRKLTEQPARPALLPGLGGFASSLGVRVGVAATLVLAIVIGLVPTGAAPEQAQAPNEALVAAVQQVVLYAPTNTFYVLQQEQAAVDAISAANYVLRRRISVGGKPTAIALDPVASRILVLDAGRKSLIEIDPASNLVVRSSPVDVTGGYTPTSLRVASDGRVVVTAARDPGQGRPGAPRPTPDSTAGEVAVLDIERKLEIVRSVDLAPRQVIPDPQGKGALFLTPSATTLVDSSYQPQRTLPGGVGAAYGAAGWIAILGHSGADAVLHLIGDGAPGPLRLTGIPLAVTSMPEGGFAVLLGSGTGDGRIVVIDEAGAPVGITSLEQVGNDLTYDPKAKRFAIVNGGDIVSAALPAGIVAREPERSDTPTPSVAPSGPVTIPQASPSASPAPSASVAPLASSSPTASTPVALAEPTSGPVVPPSAEKISDDLYRLANLSGKTPIITANSPTRMWFVDQNRLLNVLDLLDGRIFTVAELNADVSALAASASHVYALDADGARLLVFTIAGERVSSLSLPPSATALGVAPDGKAWVGSGLGTTTLMSIDPRTGKGVSVALGIGRVQAVAPDVGGRIWFSDGSKAIGFYDPVAEKLVESALPSRGSASVLLPDQTGALWVGTTAGEIFAVENGSARLALTASGPISGLALGPGGRPWYLASSASESRFSPVEGETIRSVHGPASALAINPRGRAWIVEASGSAFYLAIELAR